MEEVTKRFIEAYNYLKSAKIISSDSDFGRKLDISRSMVTEITMGRSNPGAKPLQNIVKEFGIDGNWLLIGIGDMLGIPAQNPTDTPTANRVEDMPEVVVLENTPTVKNTKTTLKTTGNTTPNRILTPQFITVDNQGKENILYVNAKAAAGYLNGYGDSEYLGTLPSFTMPGLSGGTYRSFEVDGDSMYPTLQNKQRVIGRWLEGFDYIKEDHVHVIVTKNRGIVIKRLLNRIDKYGYIIAKSDALDDRNLYPNIEIYPEEVLEIWIGVVYLGFTFRHPTDMYKRVNNIEADLTEVLRVLRQNNLLGEK